MADKTPTDFTIPLSDDFREPPRTSIGFQGRASEVAHLRHLLEHRKSGSVLVSGPRGVGKTAFVQHALDQAQPHPEVVVNLNLPLALSEGGSQVRRRVLLSMIRGLAYAVPPTKKLKVVREALDSAREKSELSDLEEHQVIGSLVQSRDSVAHERRTDIQISPAKALAALGSSLLAAATALAGVIAYLLALPDVGAAKSLIPASLVVLSGIGAGVAVKRTTHSRETNVAGSEKTAQRGRVGRYDLSDDAIEAELIQVLKKAQEKNVRPVFILDELDKVPSDKEEEIINSLLFSLKNLFTLENALFVFITSEGYYRRHWAKLRDSPYAEVHTVFTDRIFIPMLYYRDAELLIDQLLGKGKALAKDDEYKVLRNYLTWVSEGHPYDLISYFNELVTYDGGVPQFQAIESGIVGNSWKQGNLPNGWRLDAALQKFVGATFDEFSRRGFANAVFNHSLWLALSSAAHRLANAGSVEYNDEEGAPVDETLVIGLTDEEAQDLQGAVQHMLALMERFGTCSYSLAKSKSDEEPDLHSYEVNTSATYPPPDIAHATARTPEEDAMLQLSDIAQAVATNIMNAGIDLSTYKPDLDQLADAAKVLRAPGRGGKLPRHVLLDRFRSGDEILEELSEVAVGSRISSWCASNGSSIGEDASMANPRTKRPLRESLQEYIEFLRKLEGSNPEHRIIASLDNENRAVIIINMENQSLQDVADAYSAAKPGEKGGDERKIRMPVIEIRRATPGEEPIYPKEIVKIIEESDRKSWLWSIFNPLETSEEERDVAGWHVFELTESCSNLADLDSFLNESTYVANQ